MRNMVYVGSAMIAVFGVMSAVRTTKMKILVPTINEYKVLRISS